MAVANARKCTAHTVCRRTDTRLRDGRSRDPCGGSSYVVQLAGLKRGAQIVVGTPGRVIDHIERGTLDLSHVDYLVLDEADEMLTMGFAEEVDRILSETPEYKQVVLFSATMPAAIRKLTAKYLHDPVEVTFKAKTATAENISQRYIQVAGPRKMDALTRVLEVEPFEAIIVFVRTKQATEGSPKSSGPEGFPLRPSTATFRRRSASGPSRR